VHFSKRLEFIDGNVKLIKRCNGAKAQRRNGAKMKLSYLSELKKADRQDNPEVRGI